MCRKPPPVKYLRIFSASAAEKTTLPWPVICTNGYSSNSGLPTSTTFSVLSIFSFKLLLAKLIRLGNEVLFAYQSPPPLYFSFAIWKLGFCAKMLWKAREKVNMVRRSFFIIDFRFLKLYGYLLFRSFRL